MGLLCKGRDGERELEVAQFSRNRHRVPLSSNAGKDRAFSAPEAPNNPREVPLTRQ